MTLIIRALFANFMQFITTYWRIVLPIVSICAIWFYIHHLQYQRDDAISSLNAFKTQQASLASKQQSDNAVELAKRENISNDVAISYSNAVSKLKDYYAKNPNVKFTSYGVCLKPGTDTSTVQPEGKSTSEPDANPESNQPSADGVTELDCATDVLTLMKLQKWERLQEEVTK